MPHISNVAGIGIGFENPTYTVIEGSELEVCARVGAGISRKISTQKVISVRT